MSSSKAKDDGKNLFEKNEVKDEGEEDLFDKKEEEDGRCCCSFNKRSILVSMEFVLFLFFVFVLHAKE